MIPGNNLEDKNMKKYIMIAALAATLLAAGCTREILPDENSSRGKTTLTATMEPLTKADLDRSKVNVNWSAGDQINVNGSVSNALTEAAATAVFTFDATLTAPYKAVFPASIYKDASTVTLPGECGADGLNLTLSGYTAKGNNLNFSALTTLLEVSVTGATTTTLKEIVLKGLAGEQISGDFTINHSAGTLTATSSSTADKQVKIVVGKALSDTPITVYIPVPAGNYASGYQVEFVDSEDQVMRKTVSARTFKAGELREMPELAFEPNVSPDESIGGISDAAELKAFAAAVNAGNSIGRWLNTAGEVELLADIDLGGEEWTPIGNGSVTTAHAITGNAFTGVFNGGNHTVDNFKVTIPASAANVAGGLFGCVSEATIKDLTIGDKAVIKTSSNTGFVTMGAVVGFAGESTLENLDSYATLVNDAGKASTRLVIGGVAGTLFASETVATTATGLKGHARFNVTNDINTANGATGFIVGGVIGFTDGKSLDNAVQITNCTNFSDFSVQATRTAGVIGTMNSYSKAEGCVNKGNISCTDTKATNSRVAGIVSAMGSNTLITGCINYGDVMFAVSGDQTHGYAGGVIGQNNADTVIDGCASYGSVLSDRWFASEKFMGIISGNFNTKVITVKNCILGGKIGPYTPTEADPIVELTAANFDQYYSLIAANRLANVTYENNSFGGGPAPVGIASAADFAAFRDAVNAGTSLEAWQGDDGAVKLLADIDLSGVDWTPIGNATSTTNGNYAAAYEGVAFKGVFDGGNHTISGFTVNKTLAENTTYGLFGVLDGATVKNLKVEGNYTIAAANTADAGVIAGVVIKSVIENITFNGTVNVNGCTTDNKRFAVGGIAGFVSGDKTGSSVIRNCTVTATVTAVPGSCTKCGATCVMYGGIAGFVTGPKEEYDGNTLVEGCTNNGKLNTNLGRSSGIVATANSHVVLKGCVNNADQVNDFVNGRIGNIASNVYYCCGLENCTNNGSLITANAQTTTAGLTAMLSDATSYITGGANHGTIIGANTSFLGLLVANFSAFKEVTGTTVSGKLGVYAADGNHSMYEITADNYTDYLGGGLNDAKREKITNLTYVAP